MAVQNPGSTPGRRRRTGPLVASGVATLLLASCGAAPAPSGHVGAPMTEPATPAGLAAAVLTHLDGAASHGGSQNEDEKWMAVGFDVGTAARTVPLDVMVMAIGEKIDPADLRRCPRGTTVLRCRVDRAPDGSPVVLLASTEDIVGGISSDGFFLFVSHARDDHVVLVMLALPWRHERYLDMTGLPVDVQVLEAIATDPLVGSETTPELNAAGRDLPGFSPQGTR